MKCLKIKKKKEKVTSCETVDEAGGCYLKGMTDTQRQIPNNLLYTWYLKIQSQRGGVAVARD